MVIDTIERGLIINGFGKLSADEIKPDHLVVNNDFFFKEGKYAKMKKYTKLFDNMRIKSASS